MIRWMKLEALKTSRSMRGTNWFYWMMATSVAVVYASATLRHMS
jgi:hypothetical protein